MKIGVQCGEDTTGRREHDAVRRDLRLLGRTRAYASARSLSRTFAFPARFSEVSIIEVGLHGVVECRRPCPSVVEHTGYQQTSRARGESRFRLCCTEGDLCGGGMGLVGRRCACKCKP